MCGHPVLIRLNSFVGVPAPSGIFIIGNDVYVIFPHAFRYLFWIVAESQFQWSVEGRVLWPEIVNCPDDISFFRGAGSSCSVVIQIEDNGLSLLRSCVPLSIDKITVPSDDASAALTVSLPSLSSETLCVLPSTSTFNSTEGSPMVISGESSD